MKTALALVLAIFLGTVLVTTIGGIAADDTPSTSFTAPRPSLQAATTVPTTAPGAPTASAPTTATTAGGPWTYTVTEIARHATPDDCWLLVSGAVYDVTAYLARHPGGAGLITPWCGKESTEAFATEDGRGEHSSRAYSLLATYYIGDAR